MNKVIKYFVWNTFIMGTLALGCFLNERGISGDIIGVYYGIATACYLICLLGSGNVYIKKAIIKGLQSFEAWKYPFEVLFIISTIAMGYHKIGIAMFFETACILYFHFSVKEWKNEIESKNQEATN